MQPELARKMTLPGVDGQEPTVKQHGARNSKTDSFSNFTFYLVGVILNWCFDICLKGAMLEFIHVFSSMQHNTGSEMIIDRCGKMTMVFPYRFTVLWTRSIHGSCSCRFWLQARRFRRSR